MIDVRDLQIGDWIEDGYKKAQVTSITCDGIVETTAAISNIEVVEPIKLTEEILVKNGWEEQTDGTNDFFVSRILPELWHYAGTDYYSYDINIKIKYVHQLQRLLNLCNIDKEIIL